ncbi:putative nuclease HARBI1 [Bactrocera neohumeralis]|uniref:putative nuclease HARBI1 n=1 Tax=Bactrocera neohumeralis TaxID=98809 RepID=UPI0021661784|nr:putative nuclease HARBI1 [Bactrocera neohumeralis]
MFMFFNAHSFDLEEEPRVIRRRLRDNTNVLDLPNKEFVNQFRVSKEVFKNILLEIAPKMEKKFRCTSIPEMTKLACFFRALAGKYQKNVGTNSYTCVSQGMTSKIVGECLEIFEDSFCGKWICLEMNAKEESETKQAFYRSTEVPNIIGSADCTHIPIKRPTVEVRHLYQNKKGSFSINTLMICDANLVVRYVDARTPGKNDDEFVWLQSGANAYLKSLYDAGKRNFWIIGDSNLPLQPYLMTPYHNPTETYETIYNEKLLKAQKFIEKCFNTIKNRFRCIADGKAVYYLPEKATKIINVCCAIHNACIFYKDNLEFGKTIAMNLKNDNCYSSTEFESDIHATEETLKIRKKLAKSLKNSKD